MEDCSNHTCVVRRNICLVFLQFVRHPPRSVLRAVEASCRYCSQVGLRHSLGTFTLRKANAETKLNLPSLNVNHLKPEMSLSSGSWWPTRAVTANLRWPP